VVSNLVDSSVARLDLTQLLEGVHIDTTNGTAGTEEGKGTPTNPVNNVTDARIIANRDNLRAYVIVGSSITLNQDHIGWAFRGKGNAILNPGGYDLSGSDRRRKSQWYIWVPWFHRKINLRGDNCPCWYNDYQLFCEQCKWSRCSTNH
jgi:hypothetical protein